VTNLIISIILAAIMFAIGAAIVSFFGPEALVLAGAFVVAVAFIHMIIS
jgi:hypothetical protein